MRNVLRNSISSPIALVIYGLGLTFFIASVFYSNISREERISFNNETNKTIQLIRNRMAQYESALIQGRAFIQTVDEINSKNFTKYFESIELMERYPGLQGLGFAPVYKKGDKLPDTLWPKGDRKTYTPITLIAPDSKANERALGFDMYSETRRREAMDEARRLDRPVATQKIRLIQEGLSSTYSGFNMYLPIYADKEKKIVKAYLYSPFRFRRLIEALENVLDEHIYFAVYDEKDINLGSRFFEKTNGHSFGKFKVKKILPITTKKFAIEFRSLDTFHTRTHYSSVYTTLIVGTFASFLLGLISHYLAREARLIKASEYTSRENKILTDAIENSLNGFDIVSEEGKFIYVNRAYLKMWGYESAAEVLNSSPAHHCADPEIPIRIITALKKDKKCDIEFKAKRKDGSLFDVRMLAYLAYDIDGREIYPTTSIDISQQRATENHLREAVRAREEFLSIASHELKTPLTSLLLQVQMKAREDKSTKPFVDMIIKHIHRITKLVDDMLDVTRIRTGKLSLDKAQTNLEYIAKDVMKRMEQQVQTAKIEYPKISINGEMTGNWDRLRLEQVLTNLITNAIKYGDGKPFSIDLSSDGDHVTISVKDNGKGIPEEDRERIFERFERAIESKEVSGLGLGLFIVKQIVESHGGTIAVSSEVGNGSEFTVRLPRFET